MEFLSKNFFVVGDTIEAYRKAGKVAFSGIATSSLGRRLSVADYFRMQAA